MLRFLLESTSSTTATLSLVAAAIVTIVLLSKLNFKTLLAPGPWGVPILGYLPFVGADGPTHLAELARKYGDAYLLTMCGKLYIHLSSHKAVREAFISKSDDFERRSHDTSVASLLFDGSVAFKNGDSWKVDRKFWAKRLRDLTNVVKDKEENPYFSVMQSIIENLRDSRGQPLDINKLLVLQCTKVFQRLTLGEDISDDTVLQLREAYLNLVAPTEYFGSFLYGRIARYITAFKVKGVSGIFKARKQVDEIYENIINAHRDQFDPNNPKDLIDFYLLEKKTREEKDDPHAKYFNDKSFASSLLTIYGDGDVTVGEMISRFVKILVSRTDVQDAIYEEICEKIGTTRFPTFEDRNELPFTSSVIKECERVCNIFPFLPSLECNRDTTISGVYCPKGAIAIFNFYAVNNDPSVYENPKEFNPRRFLPDKKTGRLNEPLPLSFGVGKRACIGEQLVSSEVFILLTAILQHFTLKPADEEPSEEIERLSFPVTFKAIAIPREK